MTELNEGDKVFAYHQNHLYEAKVQQKETNDDGETHYFVHYHGWAKKWDEWVSPDRIMPINDETKKLRDKIAAQVKAQRKAARQASGTSKRGGGRMSGRKRTASETRSSSASSASGKRDYTSELEAESDTEEDEDYQDVEAIKLPLTYALRKIIVQDWENVTKRRCLVKIPKSGTGTNAAVSAIFKDYLEQKEEQGEDNSSLRGFIEGLRLYFDRALGAFLLYRFERPQYENVVKQQKQIVAASESEDNGSLPDEETKNLITTPEGNPRPLSEIYGAEHLLRLFVKLPQLLIHTKLTKKDHRILYDKIMDFLQFLQKNQGKYFGDSYYKPESEYLTEFAKLADTVTVSIPPAVALGINEGVSTQKTSSASTS